jgi:hypothetical protein
MLARFPDQGLSIAIMCNSGDAGSRSGMSRRIFDLFVPDTIGRKDENKAEAPATAATGSPAPDLNSKAGLYFNAQNGEPLRLVENKGKLSIAGGPALVMVDKDRFRNQEGSLNFMSNDEFELRFLPKEGFELKSKEGKITVYRRAQPYAPAPEDLKAFAGRFESDEIGTVFVITPKENGLEIRIGHSPDKSLEFKPVDGDTFQWGRMTVRFRRDKTGKVVAFDYTNPVVRNIRFTRLSNPISQP